MRVTEYEAIGAPDLRPSTPRPAGVHVTDIIQSILQQEQPERYTGALEPARLAIGFIWEAVLSRALADASGAQQVPLQCDAIHGTPDGINDAAERIDEYKATFASARRAIDEPFFEYWHMQSMAYCYMTELDTVRFHVLFICGDYVRPYVPSWLQADIVFTPDELLTNWARLLNHARMKGWLK
jgi:hypothetical protein